MIDNKLLISEYKVNKISELLHKHNNALLDKYKQQRLDEYNLNILFVNNCRSFYPLCTTHIDFDNNIFWKINRNNINEDAYYCIPDTNKTLYINSNGSVYNTHSKVIKKQRCRSKYYYINFASKSLRVHLLIIDTFV